jgi:hypothetical protein
MMAKLTKKQLLDAYAELDNVVGVEPKLDTKATVAAFSKELHETVVDLVEEGDEFTEKTKKVFATLAEQFGEPAEEEKPAKKGKKDKKEEPVAEEKPTKKGKKEKAGKSDSLVDLIKSTLKKDVLHKVIADNKEFKGDKKVLMEIKNPMALRKQMLAVLEGEKAVNIPPKKREPKKVDPLVAEVKDAKNHKALKKLCKKNDVFEGIKAKKMDEKELRAAMLAAVGVKESKKGGSGGKRAPKGEGVIATIRKCAWEASKKKGISKEEILKVLEEKFPDRDPESMKKTITAQLPNRTTNETGKPVVKLSNGNFAPGK